MEGDIEELISEINDATNDIKEEVNEIEEYRDWINSAQDNWSERTDTEREAFSNAVDDYLVRIDSDSLTWVELRSLLDELQEEYRVPIVSSIEAQLLQICDILDLDSDIVPDDEETLQKQFDEDLIDVRERIEKVLSELEKIDPLVVRYLSDSVGSDLIFSPNSLYETIDRLSNNYSDLESAVDSLQHKNWIPDGFEQILQNPQRIESEIDIEAVSTLRDSIDDTIGEFESLDGISLQTPVKHQIKLDVIENGEGIIPVFEEIEKELSNLTQYIPKLETCYEIIDEYPELSNDSFGELLDEIEDTEHRSISSIQDDLRRVESEYSSWLDQLENRWNKNSQVINFYLQGSDEMVVSLPDEIKKHLENDLGVREVPKDSLEIILKSENWISKQKETVQEELGEEAVNLIDDLINSGEVPVDRYSAEVLHQVSAEIPLLVRIDEQ